MQETNNQTAEIKIPDIAFANGEPVIATPEVVQNQRHFLATFFLSLMWGIFGADRFYMGKYGTGFLKLVTLGGFGFWALSDLRMILKGKMRDNEGNKMLGYDDYQKLAHTITFIFFAIVILIAVATSILMTFLMVQLAQGGGLQDLLNSGSSSQLDQLINF